ncbi:flavin reductase family protein [Streptomyces sp. NPDC098781]|uniref:flavin reductase family protein n=1 Tax=Streptomyces sp. NPDC098781 TaxID=3366097 RepID=UPI00380075E8
MSSFPSGLTIVTTVDGEGEPWGFTASAFCSLSLDPPLVLVCLSTTAQCHPAFETCDSWAIHVIKPEHKDLAIRFGTRGADKFGGGEFVTDDRGVPVLPDAPIVLSCSAYARVLGGDHTILVGQVEDIRQGNDAPVLYFRRDFHPLHERGVG